MVDDRRGPVNPQAAPPVLVRIPPSAVAARADRDEGRVWRPARDYPLGLGIEVD